jgi:TonB family protein
MTAYMNMFDPRDSLRKPFIGAVTVHVLMAGAVILSVWLKGTVNPFGAKDAGGAAVGIEAVNSIPLVHHGDTNPVANDSPSEVPQEPAKPEPERVKREPVSKDAIPIKTKNAKVAPKETAASPSKYRPFDEVDPNKVYSKQPQAVSTPMFQAAGAGQIGLGLNTTLGSRFGEYAARIRQLVSEQWHTGDVDASIKTAPKVILNFELMRDGSVRGVRIVQSSGVSALDFSVRRAIADAKLPPIPAEFDKNSATVEFVFELKR